MKRKHFLAAIILLCAFGISGCKIVEIPEDAYFISSSSSSFVEQLASLEESAPISETDIYYYDTLNGVKAFVADNPDTTQSLIVEKDGERTRIFTSTFRRGIICPYFNDSASKLAFLHSSMLSEDENDHMGELHIYDFETQTLENHEFYIRSYEDNRRGYYWADDDTLFISSGILGENGNEDGIGYYDVNTKTLDNVVDSKEIDYARQGVVSPDGKLIAYSGYVSERDCWVHCVVDTETKEQHIYIHKTSSNLDTGPLLECFRFIDNDSIVKERTIAYYVDADGNEVEVPESSDSSWLEENGIEKKLKNDIYTFNLRTGDLQVLIENAYEPCINHDRTKIYFRKVSVDGEAELLKRVFVYDIATGEINEAENMTSPYEIYDMEERIMNS